MTALGSNISKNWTMHLNSNHILHLWSPKSFLSVATQNFSNFIIWISRQVVPNFQAKMAFFFYAIWAGLGLHHSSGLRNHNNLSPVPATPALPSGVKVCRRGEVPNTLNEVWTWLECHHWLSIHYALTYPLSGGNFPHSWSRLHIVTVLMSGTYSGARAHQFSEDGS